VSTLKEFKTQLVEEVGGIMSPSFDISVVSTDRVPHFGDPLITFPNLDSNKQSCKVVESCVLYVDIRRSTHLNMTHKSKTVAKLYSAFVRAMTRCAVRHHGHVRGIIGDRLMVLFDPKDAFTNAVETAISMNSTARYVIDKHFQYGEIKCGIGIDFGKMLATKTGFQRRGHEQQNYRSLVWLGRPANIASKLTDLANKPRESVSLPALRVARPFLGSEWVWLSEHWEKFVNGFKRNYLRGGWDHEDSNVQAFLTYREDRELKAATPNILMTETVFKGFSAANPVHSVITKKLFSEISIHIDGYSGAVHGGSPIWTSFAE